jgi:Holliday junction resolvase RusA-like endonuclease
MRIEIEIPGEPVAQGRGRAVAFQRGDGSYGARVFDPQKSRNWKATAQGFMREAMGGRVALIGAVELNVLAVFSCPRSDWRKREPVRARWHTKRPDADNVLKAVKDAAKGVLWLDDCQVAAVTMLKRVAAQGQSPKILVTVHTLEDA